MNYEEALETAYEIIKDYEMELYNSHFIGFARGKDFLARRIADELIKAFKWGTKW